MRTVMGDTKSSSSRVLPKRQRMALTRNDENPMYSTSSSCSSSSDEDFQTSRRKWTLKKLEMFGLCYDLQSSDVSLLIGESSNYKYPLEEDKRKVVESLADQVEGLDRPGITFREGEKSRTWITYRRILQKCDETLQSVDVHLNNPPTNSKLLVLSQAALHRFYIGLREFLIESDQILAKEKPIPKHLYINLCSKFMEVFLLNVRSGLLESSGMTIKGVKSSSDPDLRATVPVSSFGRISSVLVINVEEVSTNVKEFLREYCSTISMPKMKPDYKHRVPAGPFQITEAVQHRVLEQHASQLLLDFKMSVFADIGAIFGIICMRTSLIFTCLKISWKHYELIKMHGEDVTKKGMAFEEDNEEVENERKRLCTRKEEEESESKRLCTRNEESESKRQCTRKEKTSKDSKTKERNEAKTKQSGTVFYTRPYDYLVKEDRHQITEFLFRLGVHVETL